MPMNTPLVSVIVPTCGRPQYLPRAVESALTCQGSDVEVIVVPNGPDQSWKESLATWRGDSRVHVSPIITAHGNVARNHGLSLAKGKYVRFLDDDDYLLPAAATQIAVLDRAQADLCCGLVANEDEHGNRHRLVTFPITRDFVCAAAEVSGFLLPVGTLYLRGAIVAFEWDESVNRAQDYAWMLDLARAREWPWVQCDSVVGVWFQHRATRTSTTTLLRTREESIVDRLIALPDDLARHGRLNAGRSAAVADGLWYYINRGFPSHPIYWSRIGRAAMRIDARSRQRGSSYATAPWRFVHPVALQWLLLPLRCVTRTAKRVLSRWRAPDYRREL